MPREIRRICRMPIPAPDRQLLFPVSANFGAPTNANTIAPLQTTNQIQDNLTYTFGEHSVKVGGGFTNYHDERRSGIFYQYTFPTIAAYVAAVNGTNTRSYTQYVEAFGDPEIKFDSTFYNFFAQDDWKVTRRLKLNYGLRYDLYDVPDANADSPFPASQNFKIDKNNFAPRLGVVYALREGNRPTVLRASAGIYYDVPYSDMYLRAIQNNGSPTFFNFTFGPTSAGAPAFPNNLGSLPAGTALPRQSIDTVSPDFENLYAIHTNVQIEQALTNDLSFTVGLYSFERTAYSGLPQYQLFADKRNFSRRQTDLRNKKRQRNA